MELMLVVNMEHITVFSFQEGKQIWLEFILQ